MSERGRLHVETHYHDWDVPGVRLVRAICGVLMPRADHAEKPTCPRCRAALAARAAEDNHAEEDR